MKRAICSLVLLASLSLQAQKNGNSFTQELHLLPDSLMAMVSWLTDVKELAQKDSAKAFSLLQAALKQAQDEQNNYKQAYIYRTMGQLNRGFQAYHRSFGNYLKALNFFTLLNDQREIAYAKLDLAKAQFLRGVYVHAITHFIEAIVLARKEHLPQVESDALENLGILYNAFQNFEKSVATFRQSLELYAAMNDEEGTLRVNEILGSAYYNEKKYDSAFYFTDMAVKDAERMSKGENARMSKLNRIAALIRLKMDDRAEQELAEFAGKGDSWGDGSFKVFYLALKGNLYLGRNDAVKAFYYYDSARSIAESNAILDQQATVFRHIAESYFDQRDYKSAYTWFEKYNHIITAIYRGVNVIHLGDLESILKNTESKDRIRYLDAENKMKQLQLMHELELRNELQIENTWKDSILHKEEQLAMALRGENEHRKKELDAEKKVRDLLSNVNSEQQSLLSRERKLRLLLLSAFVSMAVLGAIAFSLYRKQKKKNTIIQKQSEDLQTLMKEIHHRVKNNLQVISSLLDLQASSIKHDQAYEAVREGRNRVQSMALLHQNLYTDGNIKGIRVKNYIDNLVQGLFSSYNINPETVKLSTDIDDLNLDVDTVIPIGLILNELISNSLKYAFTLKQPGKIIVELKMLHETLLLRVKDNGQGFTSLQSLNPSASFGIKLIKAFARKLKAKLDIYNDNGACVEMQINKFKLASTV